MPTPLTCGIETNTRGSLGLAGSPNVQARTNDGGEVSE